MPAVAEILRTRVHPASLILRVERIVETPLPKSLVDDGERVVQEYSNGLESTPKVHRLLLSDDELMVQALLHKSLQYCLHSGQVVVGSLLELLRYKVLRAQRLNGKGQVFYFAIDYLEVVGATRPPSREAEIGGGFIRDHQEEQILEDERAPKRRKVELVEDVGKDNEMTADVKRESMVAPHPSQDTDSDGFESASIPVEEIEHRRRELKDLNSNVTRSQLSQLLPKPTPGKADTRVNELRRTPYPASHPEPPLHTLSSLLHPPPDSPLPSRNYHCTVFAVVSWTSPNLIHKPASPFPPKRHIKIHDPSVSDRHVGITVAVFKDARNFKPAVGTVALLRAVTMQRWEGEVILNKYASSSTAHGVTSGSTLATGAASATPGPYQDDGDVEQEEWFMSDHQKLQDLGYDVERMQDWWEQRKRKSTKALKTTQSHSQNSTNTGQWY